MSCWPKSMCNWVYLRRRLGGRGGVWEGDGWDGDGWDGGWEGGLEGEGDGSGGGLRARRRLRE